MAISSLCCPKRCNVIIKGIRHSPKVIAIIIAARIITNVDSCVSDFPRRRREEPRSEELPKVVVHGDQIGAGLLSPPAIAIGPPQYHIGTIHRC
jgi:hypothetical protein